MVRLSVLIVVLMTTLITVRAFSLLRSGPMRALRIFPKARVMYAQLRMVSTDKAEVLSGPPVFLLSCLVSDSLTNAFGAEVSSKADPLIFPAKPEHGDYQCNAALPLGKILKERPRDVAVSLMKSMQENSGTIIQSMDISGPGFINIRLSDDYIVGKLNAMLDDTTGRLNVREYKQETKKQSRLHYNCAEKCRDTYEAASSY